MSEGLKARNVAFVAGREALAARAQAARAHSHPAPPSHVIALPSGASRCVTDTSAG